MNKITVFVLFALIFSSIAPVTSFAQTSTTTSTSTPVSDGSTESWAERRERIRNWQRQSSEVEQKINTLSTSVVTSIPIPILFGVALRNISPNFGDPRGGGTRTHEGEDIMGVKGTPIVSPTQAIVIKTGTGSTEGHYVYTANPGGETFVYMHLDRIGEGVVAGATLETGSLIGYVGNTGNASGGAAHLHFEIHNSNRDPLDPFPRITKEFTIEEKMLYVSKIMTQTSDQISLATLLVSNFRSTFTEAQSKGITLPPAIVNVMNTLSPSTPGTTVTPTLPAGDLTIGSRGIEVTNLQTFLIQKAVGAESKKLAEAGATGYFGVITENAVREYQIAMNISPANGYYGPATRTSVTLARTNTPVVTTPTTPPASSGALVLTRNLYKGLSGEDVRLLQKFLNSKGFVIATSGSGSVGNETTYFGAATEAAVIRFQKANNITPAAGYVGLITRGIIASK